MWLAKAGKFVMATLIAAGSPTNQLPQNLESEDRSEQRRDPSEAQIINIAEKGIYTMETEVLRDAEIRVSNGVELYVANVNAKSVKIYGDPGTKVVFKTGEITSLEIGEDCGCSVEALLGVTIGQCIDPKKCFKLLGNSTGSQSNEVSSDTARGNNVDIYTVNDNQVFYEKENKEQKRAARETKRKAKERDRQVREQARELKGQKKKRVKRKSESSIKINNNGSGTYVYSKGDIIQYNYY